MYILYKAGARYSGIKWSKIGKLIMGDSKDSPGNIQSMIC